MAMILMLVALLVPSARAECPWAGADSLRLVAEAKAVKVNDAEYKVDGSAERIAFGVALAECNANAAIDPFFEWRLLLEEIGDGKLASLASLQRQAAIRRDQFLVALKTSKPPAKPAQ